MPYKSIGCPNGAKDIDIKALKKKYRNRLMILGIYDDRDMSTMAVMLWNLLGYEEIKQKKKN